MNPDVFAPIEARNKAIVLAQTWGHLEAMPGVSYPGSFTFINGQHGDVVVIESDFGQFGEGPGYFAEREEYIFSKTMGDGPCSAHGVYRFEGEYRGYKRSGKGVGYFSGPVTKVKLSSPARKKAA